MNINKNKLKELYIKEKWSTVKIAEYFGCCRTTIDNYIKKYKIPKRKERARKYYANDNFFSKWSHDMAYCLGFIAADGHVWKNRPYFTVGIKECDSEILNFIISKVSPNSKVRKTKDKVQITIHSKQIWKDLKGYNIDNNKTFNLNVDYDIPEKFFPDFLRGFFDGDGSIYQCGKYKYYNSSIVSASRDILLYFQNKLNFGRLRKFRKKYFVLEFNQEECLKLKEIMYNGNFSLLRKKEKFFNINKKLFRWTKKEDDIVLSIINSNNTKQIFDLLPNRSPKSIQARKNYLRKCNQKK